MLRIKEGRLVATLFGEAPGRVLVATKGAAGGEVSARARAWGVPLQLVGRSGADSHNTSRP